MKILGGVVMNECERRKFTALELHERTAACAAPCHREYLHLTVSRDMYQLHIIAVLCEIIGQLLKELALPFPKLLLMVC